MQSLHDTAMGRISAGQPGERGEDSLANSYQHLTVRFSPFAGFSESGVLYKISHHRQGAVIVAMVTVRMMQMAGDQIVKMIAMRYCFMAAIRAVLMSAFHVRCTPVGKAGGHLKPVLVYVTTVHVMQVAIVKIIHVSIMPDSCVAAVRSMFVNVCSMMLHFRMWHGCDPFITEVKRTFDRPSWFRRFRWFPAISIQIP